MLQGLSSHLVTCRTFQTLNIPMRTGSIWQSVPGGRPTQKIFSRRKTKRFENKTDIGHYFCRPLEPSLMPVILTTALWLIVTAPKVVQLRCLGAPWKGSFIPRPWSSRIPNQQKKKKKRNQYFPDHIGSLVITKTDRILIGEMTETYLHPLK